jgi:hypothetical protein
VDDATIPMFPAYARRRRPEAAQDPAGFVEAAVGRASGQGVIRPLKAAI